MKKKFSAVLLSLLALILVTQLPSPAAAEGLTELKESFITYQTAPMERAAELRKQLAEVRNTEDGLARQYGIHRSDVLSYEIVLSDIINYYETLYYLRKHGSVLQISLPDEERLASVTAEKPPYSFLFFLDFLEDVYTCKREIEREEYKAELSKKSKLRCVEERGELERRCRLVASKRDNKDGEMLKLRWEMMQAESKLELSEAELAFHKLNVSFLETSILELKTKLAILEEVLDKIRGNVDVSETDFAFLDSIMSSKINKVRKSENALNVKYTALEEIKNSTETTEFMRFFSATEEAHIITEIRFLLDFKVYIRSVRLAFRVMDEILEGDMEASTYKDMIYLSTDYLRRLNLAEKQCINFIYVITSAQKELDRRFVSRSSQMTPEDMVRLEEERTALTERKERFLYYISEISKIKQLYLLLDTEVRRMEGSLPGDEKIEAFWYDRVISLADKELWHIGDYPITLARLIRGIIVFILCILVTRSLAGWFTRKSRKRGHLSAHEILLIRKTITGSGFIFSLLATLWSLRIPLTALAFLGGAMAIALGLGTQKIMGDFFAGILLLFQGKIRVGDEVVIDDVRGIVTELTIQKTVLRTVMNKELVIPNSKVHDSAVINLTLTNSKLMLKVEVGVAYDSDVKKVTEILTEVVKKHPAVLKKPEPAIIFSEFEDSALLFEVRFFIDLKKNYESVVKSDIRYAIMEAFEKEGITIPFPQRDVHLTNSDK